ncbi:MAG TPA: DUF4389 domain-containing protein, partial [Solirubrobacteraceae bacterium]|nr:DUF4389 domain-containing protein [Solirubrobacteraceae bacterium]
MDHLSIAPEKPAQLFLRPPLTPADQVRTLNYDDLHRWRVSVGFRFFMAIPHLLWLGIWGFGMLLLSPVLWIATLINRRPPEGLRDVYAMWVRYSVHVYAFLYLAASPFPGFLGKPGTYPIEVEVPPSGEHGRWSVGFRFVLALPALLLAGALVGLGGGGGSNPSSSGQSDPTTSAALNLGVAATVAFLAWFACLARGRMPQGMRDLLVWALGYAAQAYAYLFLLTARYPNSNPAIAPLAALPEHPVRLRLTDELRRNRWTVAFRLILAMPHLLWFALWTLLVIPLAIVTWFVTLVAGRTPSALHRFLSAWVRYSSHYSAFLYLGGGPFPGVTGAPGSYPVDIEIEGPERQNRWTVLFRGLLGL